MIKLSLKLQVAANELALRTTQQRIFDSHAKLSNKLLQIQLFSDRSLIAT